MSKTRKFEDFLNDQLMSKTFITTFFKNDNFILILNTNFIKTLAF